MKKLIPSFLSGALLVTLAGAPVFAKEAKQSKAPETRFERLDQNHDGKLSLEEFQGKHAKNHDKAAKRFKKLDANGDGFLTPDELQAHAKHAPKK